MEAEFPYLVGYGLTESAPLIAGGPAGDTTIAHGSAGKPIPGVEVKIMDPETGEELGNDMQGEICCRGYNLMKGYYNNPEATEKAIDKDGWLHSGDLAVKTEDGFYRITGRIKDMIVRGGENIYPREIENYLYQIPQIEAVEVAGVPSPKYGEAVGAFIKLKKDESLSEEEVIDFCRGKIARFKIPKYIFFVDGFPMTASGKIQKYKLREIACEQLGIKATVFE